MDYVTEDLDLTVSDIGFVVDADVERTLPSGATSRRALAM